MHDLDDFNPPVGVAEELAPGLRRILAPNPSPMTYRGTNTYLLGTRDLAVIDPGPEDDAHLEAILSACLPGQGVSHIFVTHAHLDHSPLSRRLSEVTGAPILAYGDAQAGRSAVMQALARDGLAGGGEGVHASFVPDIHLRNDKTISGDGWDLTAIWTPGHFGNHMSFACDQIVFTGDIVMGWASSLVSPPDGDLTDFMASCACLKKRNARVFYPGHGAPIRDPSERLEWLIQHRLGREAAILKALEDGPASSADLTVAIYTDTPPALLPAARRNVFAHLVDLCGRGIIRSVGPLSENTHFHKV